MKTTLFALTAITASLLTANFAAADSEIYNWKTTASVAMDTNKSDMMGVQISAASTSREIFNDKANLTNTVSFKDSGSYNMIESTYTPLYQN